MYRIYIVLCGGTICTEVEEKGCDRVRTITQKAGILLRKNFYDENPQLKNEVEFECSENFGILSENMTIGKWNALIDFFRENENGLKGYDGIIIAHGTDTLAYSSALFSLLLKSLEVPVFFVSSNAPLENKKANGNANFKAAVECIRKGITPNVYVVYRNPSSGRMMLHLSSRLEQCRDYEEDFYSTGAVDITDIRDDGYAGLFSSLTALTRDPGDEKASGPEAYKPLLNGEWHLEDSVLKIDPYVGLRYDCFDLSKFKAVLHGTYHSGTVCVSDFSAGKEISEPEPDSILYLTQKSKDCPDIFLSPAGKEGEIYASVKELAQRDGGRIKFLYGCTAEMAYVKLLLAYALEIRDVEAFMNKEINHEMMK